MTIHYSITVLTGHFAIEKHDEKYNIPTHVFGTGNEEINYYSHTFIMKGRQFIISHFLSSRNMKRKQLYYFNSKEIVIIQMKRRFRLFREELQKK